jgi:hypothetical protein
LSVLAVVQLACSFFGTIALALGLLLANRFLMGAGFLLLMSASQSAFLTMRAYSFQGSNFSRAAWAPVFRSFLFPLGALLMWYMTPEPHYGSALFLLIAALLSDIFVIFHLAGGLGQSERRALSLKLVKRGWQDIVEHKSWIASNSFFQIVNLLALQAPINMIGLIYGGQEAGWFALSQRIAFAPALFLGLSITSVVQRKAAEQFHASQSMVSKIGLVSVLNFAVLIVGYGCLYVISLLGLDQLLGSSWHGAETTFHVMLIWAMIYGLGNSFSFILTLQKMNKTQVWLAVARIATMIGAFAFSAYFTLPYFSCLVILACGEICYYVVGLSMSLLSMWNYEKIVARKLSGN